MSDQAETVAHQGRRLEALFEEALKKRTSLESVRKQVLRFQRANCPVYRDYCDRLADAEHPFPYLPIEAFKLAAVTSHEPEESEAVFESSGTTGQVRSKHFVRSLSLYQASLLDTYRRFFGDEPSVIIGHLPGYVEQGRSSSLAYMVQHLIEVIGIGPSETFTDDRSVLSAAIEHCDRTGIRLVLIGAAFGLMGIAEQSLTQLPPNAVVIETGGMKTNRREVSRDTLHQTLALGFNLSRTNIASEYGMTEMLSQAYSMGSGWYQTPLWLTVAIVDPQDPNRRLSDGEEGVIALTDLANIHSVSRILTEDRGVAKEGRFQVLGRIAGVELRGCNFLMPDS